MSKNKTLATYLTLFFGIFGIHILYLNKPIKYFILHLWASIIGGLGVFIFLNSDINTSKSLLIWILLCIFMLNWCIVWLTSIYYGLMPVEKWLAFTNYPLYSLKNQNINNTNINVNVNIDFAATTSITVVCIVMALLIGMGSLMAFLAFAFQSYFEATL